MRTVHRLSGIWHQHLYEWSWNRGELRFLCGCAWDGQIVKLKINTKIRKVRLKVLPCPWFWTGGIRPNYSTGGGRFKEYFGNHWRSSDRRATENIVGKNWNGNTKHSDECVSTAPSKLLLCLSILCSHSNLMFICKLQSPRSLGSYRTHTVLNHVKWFRNALFVWIVNTMCLKWNTTACVERHIVVKYCIAGQNFEMLEAVL